MKWPRIDRPHKKETRQMIVLRVEEVHIKRGLREKVEARVEKLDDHLGSGLRLVVKLKSKTGQIVRPLQREDRAAIS